MKLLLKQEWSIGETNIKFLRVKVDNLESNVREIIKNLYDVSWLNKLATEELKVGFMSCAEPTIKRMCKDLETALEGDSVSDIGEYIVSNVARLIVEECYNYYVLPLAELLKEKVSNNSGFDYHFQTNENIPVFGEAKYVANSNAYGKALSQVNRFIKENKDKKEIQLLSNFLSREAISNIVLGNKGYSISFSTTEITSEKLIEHILENEDFKKLLEYKEIIMVAVEI